MQQHKQLERALQIGRVAPFHLLALESRFILGGITIRRSYGPGSVILAADAVPEEVLIPVSGSVLHAGVDIRHAFDVPGVLTSTPLGDAYVAGPAGCTLLCLTKSHMYTLMRECPRVIEPYIRKQAETSCG